MSPVGAMVGRRSVKPGGTTYTFYPSAQSGHITSYSEASYSTARSGGDLSVATGDYIIAGQDHDPADPGESIPESWVCQEGFLDFDLSAVTGTVTSATLSLGLFADGSDVDLVCQARTRDWGTTLTTADWVAGASLGSLTLLATLASSGIGATGSYKTFTESGTALKDAVVATGTGVLRMIVCSDRHEAGTGPPAYDPEYLMFDTYAHATLKPKLVVVTT